MMFKQLQNTYVFETRNVIDDWILQMIVSVL